MSIPIRQQMERMYGVTFERVIVHGGCTSGNEHTLHRRINHAIIYYERQLSWMSYVTRSEKLIDFFRRHSAQS